MSRRQWERTEQGLAEARAWLHSLRNDGREGEVVEDGPDWEGQGGSEHRTVGPHRAWCYQDVSWCYPDALCACCDQARIPRQWAGFHPAELLDELRRAINTHWEAAEQGIADDAVRHGYRNAIDNVLLILEGKSPDG